MVFHLDLPQVIAMLVGVILPLITGKVTTSHAAPGVRAVVLLALAAVTSFLSELVAVLNTGGVFDAGASLVTVLSTFLIGVGTYFGFWNPTGVAGALKNSGGFIGSSSRSGGTFTS